MTKITLLERLKEFSEARTRDLLLPVQMQEKDEAPPPDRAPAVYIPSLPELRSYARKAPFLTHEIVTGKDAALPRPGGGRTVRSTAVARTCFCVYHPDGQAGRLALLTLMERLRMGLLEEVVLGKQFKLDLEAGVEALVYPVNPNQTAEAPFYLGEMLTTWQLPVVERRLSSGNEPIDFRGGGYPGGPDGGL